MEAVDVNLRTMLEAGVSLRETGKTLGVSATTVYRRIVASGDTLERRRRRPLSSEDRARILRIANAGELSIRRIAATVGRGWHVVRRVLGSNTPRLCPPHRCPHCGYRINVQPCQVCRAKAS